MIVILMLDGLDIKFVLKYSYKNIVLKYPRIKVHDFRFLFTPYIWEMFLTGRKRRFFLLEFRRNIFNIIKIFNGYFDNMSIFKKFKEYILPFKFYLYLRIRPEETFLKFFKNFSAINVPLINYPVELIKKQKEIVDEIFKGNLSKDKLLEFSLEMFNKTKKMLMNNLGNDYDLILCYFDILDVLQHFFNENIYMLINIYKEIDKIVGYCLDFSKHVMIITDHCFGYKNGKGFHTRYFFYTFSKEPKFFPERIDEFYSLFKYESSEICY